MIYLNNNQEVKNSYIVKAKERMKYFDKQFIMDEWVKVIEGRE